MLNRLEGGVVQNQQDYLIEKRVGGNCFFQGPL